MSYRRRRANRNNRNNGVVPLLVERVTIEQQAHGKSYEEANWARLSPKFREAHNRLRVARGLPPLAPPRVDQYVAPPAPRIVPVDPADRDMLAAARSFMGGGLLMGPRGGEGYSRDGMSEGDGPSRHLGQSHPSPLLPPPPRSTQGLRDERQQRHLQQWQRKMRAFGEAMSDEGFTDGEPDGS